jgi:hypothetical protein
MVCNPALATFGEGDRNGLERNNWQRDHPADNIISVLSSRLASFFVESLTRNWDASKQRFFTIGARFAMMVFWASPLRGSKTT